MRKQDKTMPLTRPDGGLAFTSEDRAWQIYRLRTFGMSNDKIKELMSVSNEEFDFCATLIPKLRRKFAATSRRILTSVSICRVKY
ncbi:MAG: hypothetical protein ABSF44_15755 [Candidatus Bathyarchaeia archaeon]